MRREGEIMKFCHPLKIDGCREHSRCTGVREGSQVDGRAAGMQPMLIHWIFLKDVPWSMMDYQHATQGEVLSKKKSFGPSGVMSQHKK